MAALFASADLAFDVLACVSIGVGVGAGACILASQIWTPSPSTGGPTNLGVMMQAVLCTTIAVLIGLPLLSLVSGTIGAPDLAMFTGISAMIALTTAQAQGAVIAYIQGVL